MRYLVMTMRFTMLTLSTIIMLAATLIIAPFSRKPIQQTGRKFWCYTLIKFSGAKLNIRGTKIDKELLTNTMIISNHISWLDTVVLLHLCFIRFIGKVEMLKWPLLNQVIRAGDTIFINRKNKREIPNINKTLATILASGATVGLYPEGTSGDGYQVAPFKAPLLEAALMAKSKILPVVISYRKENDLLATEVTFKKVGWFTTIFRTIGLKNLVINVTILPAVDSSQFPSRDALATHLHELVNTCYLAQQTKL